MDLKEKLEWSYITSKVLKEFKEIVDSPTFVVQKKDLATLDVMYKLLEQAYLNWGVELDVTDIEHYICDLAHELSNDYMRGCPLMPSEVVDEIICYCELLKKIWSDQDEK